MSRPGRRTQDTSQQDTERFHRLYTQTSQDLLAFLLRRCQTAEDAADCLSETYRIAWQKRRQIPVEDTRAWLFGAARNVARRQHTTATRQAAATRELALAAKHTDAIAPLSATTRTALDALSPLDREIITMLAWDDLAPREVAIILGISPNVLRVRAHRARAQLRATLTPPAADTPVQTTITSKHL